MFNDKQIQITPLFVFDIFIDNELNNPMTPLINFALGPKFNYKIKKNTVEPFINFSPCLKYTIKQHKRFWNSGIYLNFGITFDQILKLGIVNHFNMLDIEESASYYFGLSIGIQFQINKN